MAATLTLDTITSSGSTITVPTGKTLAVVDAGNLTIGGVAITTGAHATAVSAVDPLTITSGNVTGKSNYTVSYNASSGTSTAMVVNLPTPANFQTTVISVVSSTTHGAGNKIEIRNSAGAEVYTLYHKGDHCEFVSDGTNTLRAGNEYVTLRGHVCATANFTAAAGGNYDVWDSMSYSEIEDLGSTWSTVNDDFTAPFDGEFMFQGDTKYSAYLQGYNLMKNGVYLAGSHTNDNPGQGQINNYPVPLVTGDVITYWCANTAWDSRTWYGSTSATAARMRSDWWCVRRY
jgi:hypothetical protein